MAKQLNQIIGSFVFRDEGDGCLTSKYQHADSRECPFTEACKIIAATQDDSPFIGTYRTVWLEDWSKPVDAELNIIRHPQNPRIFKLKWYHPGAPAEIIFDGTGMLYGDLLTGAYWDI